MLIRAKILLIYHPCILGEHLSAHIEPLIKNKQISEEDNFDEDDVVIAKCIGGSGVEEKVIMMTSLDLSLNLSTSIPKHLKSEDCWKVLDLLNQKFVQVSFIINSIICTCVEIVVDISGVFF